MGGDGADRWLTRGFQWRDGARLIRYAVGARTQTLALLSSESLQPFTLLTTARAVVTLPDVAAAALVVAHVPSGPVPEAAAAVEARLIADGLLSAGGQAEGERVARGSALVALGGGRVIDAAKALAAAHGLEVAAVPTTLSGAEMTPLHRPLPDGRGSVRRTPRLVVTDPGLLTQPIPDLAATAMNAFGHAMEALYLPAANPVASMAALEAARLLIEGLEAAEGERRALALGGLLAGYAIGATGLGFHHALCQTVARETGAPHAQVYAVLTPHSLRFMLPRVAEELAPLVALLAGGEPTAASSPPPDARARAVGRLSSMAARSGVTGLLQLGVSGEQLPSLATAALARPEVRGMVSAPSRDELTSLLERAL